MDAMMMKRRTLPKLNSIELSQHVMDLLMVQDGNEVSISEPRVRLIWHLWFFSIIVFTLVSFLILPLLNPFFPRNTLVATIWRVFVSLFWIYCLALLAMLAVRHYLFLLRTGKDLKFGNILFFYFAGVAQFAHLYRAIFFLKPSLFAFPAPVVSPLPHLTEMGLKGFLLLFGFLLYSASVIVSIDYPRIDSASAMVSICNVAEVLFGLCILSLLVATFVQKTESKRPTRLS